VHDTKVKLTLKKTLYYITIRLADKCRLILIFFWINYKDKRRAFEMSKLSGEQYNALVEKLASEIIEGANEQAIEEKTAEENTEVKQEPVEKTAADKAKILANRVKVAKQFAEKHKKELTAGAVGAVAGYEIGGNHGGKKADEESDQMEVLAAEESLVAIIEKAATVYEDAQYMKQAAEQIMDEAQIYEDAVAQIFKEAGLLDEDEYATDDVEGQSAE
jgi:uncharacterized protein YcfJ